MLAAPARSVSIFQSSSCGPFNFAAFSRICASCSSLKGLNCCAIRTSSSIWPMVVQPSARQ